MKIVITKCGEKIYVSDRDYEKVSSLTWRLGTHGYAERSVKLSNGRWTRELMHRLILGLEYGDDRQVDHINGVRTDNTRENLRFCDHSQNMRNKKLQKNNTSGFKGVTWNKVAKKWQAQIYVSRKRIHLGYYIDPSVAYEAYCAASEKMHGAFSNKGMK